MIRPLERVTNERKPRSTEAMEKEKKKIDKSVRM